MSRDNPRVKKIVILISGAGSNMAAIVQAAHQQRWGERLGVQVAAVISNKPDASGHQVTAELDHGQILAQAAVPVLPGDSAQDLAARVLTQEHLIYPAAVEAFFKP